MRIHVASRNRRRFRDTTEVPSKGRILPSFDLPAASSPHKVRLSDYRGLANLVVIVDDGRSATASLVSDAARRYGEIKSNEAEVLLIARPHHLTPAADQGSLKTLPYPLLIDQDGSVHRQLGALDPQGQDSAAIYITDRFGEVFGVYRKAAGQSVPEIADILSWLEFINAQCPECEPPEWPI